MTVIKMSIKAIWIIELLQIPTEICKAIVVLIVTVTQHIHMYTYIIYNM